MLRPCTGAPATEATKTQLRRLARGQLPSALGAGSLGPPGPPPPEVLTLLLGAPIGRPPRSRGLGPDQASAAFWAPSAKVRRLNLNREQTLLAYGLTEEELARQATCAFKQAAGRSSREATPEATYEWEYSDAGSEEVAGGGASEDSDGC